MTNLGRRLVRGVTTLGLLAGTAASACGQYLMIPDSASATTTPASGSPRVALFSAADGSLVDASFIPQAASPYVLSAPKQALQVGNEIWVADQVADAVFCFTAVFDKTNPNPALWSRPSYLRTISGGLDNIRGLVKIADRVYVLNTGTANGAPGNAVVVFETDGTFVSSFPIAATNAMGVDNLNGQLLVSDFLGGNCYMYGIDGSGGVMLTGTPSPQQVSVLPTGSGGASEVWVSLGSGATAIRRYDAAGSVLANYEAGVGCRGAYVLINGDVLFTDQKHAGTQTGGVKKFTPDSPIVKEIQTVTITGTSGTYTLTYNGQTTAAITYPNSPATALGNLSTIGSGNVTVSGGTSPYTVTFSAQLPRVLLTGATVTGDLSVSAAVTTPGAGTITAMLDTGTTAGTGVVAQFISPFTPTTPVTTNPSASGFPSLSTNQAAVLAGTATTLTVNATPGLVPQSTNLAAKADLSAFGGSASQTITPASGASNNTTFTYVLNVPAGQPGGRYNIPLTVTDAQSRTGFGTLPITIIATPPAGAFSETEANNTKAAANAVSLTPGKVIWGTTTGSTGTGVTSADVYRLTTAAAPLGIYVHTMNLATSGTGVHAGSIRGLNQTSSGSGGAIGTTDTQVQAVLVSGPPVQWYGFGKQEQVYYRVEGAAATTAEYLATYQTSPVIPTVVPEVLTPGSVTITPAAGNNARFSMCLYDSNLNAIAGSPYMSSTTSGGSVTRTLGAGVYYLALSDVTMANNLAAPADSAVQTNPALDFPNAVVNAQNASFSGTPTNVSVTLAHAGGAPILSAIKTNSFEILWYKIYVGAPGSPQVDGSATPTPVIAGTTTQLTAAVTPCLDSTGLAVSANLLAFGGSSSQAMTDSGGNTFTFSLDVPTAQGASMYTIPITVTDAQSRSSTGSVVLRVLPAVPAGFTLESESNDSRPTANFISVAPGTGVYGTSTGTQAFLLDPAPTRDHFTLFTPAAAPGIYRNRMTITTSGVAGHVGTLRGRTQVSGSIDTNPAPFFEPVFQTSINHPSSARFNQWYGFGRGEQMEYRVDGTTLTTSEYVSTFTSTIVTPVIVPSSIQSGSVTIARAAGNSASTGMWLYDSMLQPIADAGAQGGSVLTRTLAAGTYYLAVSDGNTANNLATPADSSARSQPVLAFPDSIANASSATWVNMNMQITHGGGAALATATKTGAFDVVWYQLNVTDGPTTQNCCRGTTCTSVTAGTCTGTVAGSNSTVVTTCTGNTFASCCFGDYDHNGVKDITDIFTFLNAWFSASPYADITGNGAGTPDITDIFTFLNAWFGVCS